MREHEKRAQKEKVRKEEIREEIDEALCHNIK